MEDNFNTKNIIIYIIVIVLSILFIIFGNKICKTEISQGQLENFYKAKVIEVGQIETNILETNEDTTYETKTIHFKVKITSGDKKGQTVNAVQSSDPTYAMQSKEIEVKDRIIITNIAVGEGSTPEWTFTEYQRSNILIWLVVFFLFLILLLGGIKGAATILSLLFTVLAILFIYIPGIINGFNVYVLTIVVSIFIIFMSLIIINGINKKTLCAIIGNLGGVAVAGIIAFLMSKLLGITGVVDEEYVFLMNSQLGDKIDLVAIVWGGIVIGSLGAVMDVAMSISSAMKELADNMDKRSFSQMLKSGMNIGRDAIGTMTNTLILAYVGSSLATVLLLVMYSKNTLYLFNMEMIIVEIMQSIVGSMGILFAVPATALIAACIFSKIGIEDMNKYIKSEGNRDIKL